MRNDNLMKLSDFASLSTGWLVVKSSLPQILYETKNSQSLWIIQAKSCY